MGISAHFAKPQSSLHYWLTGILAICVIPLLRALNLPTHFDWLRLMVAYWVLLAARAIFVAAILYWIGISSNISFRPAIHLLQTEKLRVAAILIYFAILLVALSWTWALLITVDTIAVLGVRQTLKPGGLRRVASAVLPAAIYLFCGLLLVSAYNDIILSVRFFAASDSLFNSMDKFLLHGLSVSMISHWALRALPISFFQFLEFVYYGMFAVLGASMILVSQWLGRQRALQFVGAVLTAYYLALILFYLWPSQGPYYLCLAHFSQFPASLKTFAAQQGSIAGAEKLSNHQPPKQIFFDYYIAFPCMHIVQPLIGMWFLRAWRRITVAFAVYNVFLVVAIVLLEWHYVIDIFAGVLIAGLAIATVDGRELWRHKESAGVTTTEKQSCAIPT